MIISAPAAPKPAATEFEPTDDIARLIVILAHQHDITLPALASAQRWRDTVLVEGEIDEAFAHDLNNKGFRLARRPDAPLETRIARALRGCSKRRITVTEPADVIRYDEIVSWAPKFGVTVDIYFNSEIGADQRAVASG